MVSEKNYSLDTFIHNYWVRRRSSQCRNDVMVLTYIHNAHGPQLSQSSAHPHKLARDQDK